LQARVLAVTRATGELRTRDGRTPTAGRLAEHLDMPLEDVLVALQAGRAYGATSLEAPLGGEPGAGTLRDVLDDRDREVLRLRFVEDLTQSQIAERVGCSQMQVSRLLRRAVDRLSERATAMT
jgi:RNA polymerase sigma-B factor